MRVEVDAVSESLDGDDDAGGKLFDDQGFKIEPKGPDSRPAELSQETAPELEEDPQRLGDRQDHLAVRNIQE